MGAATAAPGRGWIRALVVSGLAALSALGSATAQTSALLPTAHEVAPALGAGLHPATSTAPPTRHRPMAERVREEMLDDLMAWAVRLSGLPRAADRPEVISVSLASLTATVCPDDPASCRGLVAVYDTERIRVLVRDTLDLRELSSQSFIVHEFIHHLQHRAQGAALTSGCEQVMAAERQAYEAQNRFLQQHRQMLRVGEMLRGMRCDRADASEPTVEPIGSRGTGALSARTP
jgi:hypothetical protein